MKELAAFALTFLSAVSYFVMATGFGLYQRWPVVHIALCLFALAWLVDLLRKSTSLKRRIYAAVLLAFSAGLTALFGWYTLDYSTYDSVESSVTAGEALGDRLAEIRLASRSGAAVPVFRPDEGRATLLVFYRGHW